MKISIIGDMPEDGSFIPAVDAFVKDHKVGTPVIISAGSLETLAQIGDWCKSQGYDNVIMGNTFNLATLNADKVVLIWNGESKKYQEVLDLCIKTYKPYREIKTK